MKAVCTVYHNPHLRFTPNHCDHFLHLGLKEDCYPFGIVVEGIEWGWFLKSFDGVWKVLPECGYFIEDDTIQDVLNRGKARVVVEEWRHPASGRIFLRTSILVKPWHPLPVLFDRSLWHGTCLRCGSCCSVPRRRTGMPCEYLRFVP